MFAIGSLFFIRSWTLGVRCSMFNLFNVGRSSFKPTPYGINATCECLQNNLALMHPIPGSKAVSISYTGCHKYVPYWTLSTTRRRHNKLPLSERYFDKRSRQIRLESAKNTGSGRSVSAGIQKIKLGADVDFMTHGAGQLKIL